MKKYLLIDKFDNTEQVKTEKEIRDLYFDHVEEIIFNWKDCNDPKIFSDLEKEKEEVYTCDFSKVKMIMEEDCWYYEIKEIEE